MSRELHPKKPIDKGEHTNNGENSRGRPLSSPPPSASPPASASPTAMSSSPSSARSTATPAASTSKPSQLRSSRFQGPLGMPQPYLRGPHSIGRGGHRQERRVQAIIDGDHEEEIASCNWSRAATPSAARSWKVPYAMLEWLSPIRMASPRRSASPTRSPSPRRSPWPLPAKSSSTWCISSRPGVTRQGSGTKLWGCRATFCQYSKLTENLG
ncbi:uncharacterized protein J3R85_009441 [Psidium guajava]|nr:uncharacterized protein J3R85_009441 [Psidium guajava]